MDRAQLADAIVGIDGDDGGTAGVAHDLERQTVTVRQLHGIDTDLDDATVVDRLAFEQHAASVPKLFHWAHNRAATRIRSRPQSRSKSRHIPALGRVTAVTARR